MKRFLSLLIGAGLLLSLLLIGRLLFLVTSSPPQFAQSEANQPVAAQAAATTALAATPTAAPLPTPTIPPPPATATSQPTPRPTTAPFRSRFTFQPGDRIAQIKPGVIHVRRETADPLKINILLFDLKAPQFDLAVAVGDGWLAGRHRTSYIAEQNNALAAVNGDLFSSTGIPQGLTIINSRVAIAPKYRATFAWSRTREPFIGYFTDQWTWKTEVRAANGARAPLGLLNTPCDEGQICLFNDFARFAPPRAGGVNVVIGERGYVTNIVREQRVRVLTDTQVLHGTGAGARWLLQNVAIGDRLVITTDTDPPLTDYSQAISGGPIILREGAFVQDCLCALRDCRFTKTPRANLLCEDFTTDWKEHHYLWVRMPRTGIGFDKQKQTLIVAVVDGYQRGYSRGITQEEFADLLREFGAYTAMELDGGGSSTMVLRDRLLNRPPDDTGERYVANALLFFWRDKGDRETRQR